jgi:superfamily II DNA helicase RecQ
MRLQFFSVPACGGDAAAVELNRFLATHRVLRVDRELVHDGAQSLWAVCVQWAPTADPEAPRARAPGERKGVDYKELLSAADFAIYSTLRQWRVAVGKAEGLAGYLPLNNEQLAQVAQRRPTTLAALEAIEGIGPSKRDKYGAALLALAGGAPLADWLPPPPAEATDAPHQPDQP